jgi:hypothetical protein
MSSGGGEACGIVAVGTAVWCVAVFAPFLTPPGCPRVVASSFAPLRIANLCVFGGPTLGFGVGHALGVHTCYTYVHFCRSCFQRSKRSFWRPQRCPGTSGRAPLAAWRCPAPHSRHTSPVEACLRSHHHLFPRFHTHKEVEKRDARASSRLTTLPTSTLDSHSTPCTLPRARHKQAVACTHMHAPPTQPPSSPTTLRATPIQAVLVLVLMMLAL